jgi:hypothetical protein
MRSTPNLVVSFSYAWSYSCESAPLLSFFIIVRSLFSPVSSKKNHSCMCICGKEQLERYPIVMAGCNVKLIKIEQDLVMCISPNKSFALISLHLEFFELCSYLCTSKGSPHCNSWWSKEMFLRLSGKGCWNCDDHCEGMTCGQHDIAKYNRVLRYLC